MKPHSCTHALRHSIYIYIYIYRYCAYRLCILYSGTDRMYIVVTTGFVTIKEIIDFNYCKLYMNEWKYTSLYRAATGIGFVKIYSYKSTDVVFMLLLICQLVTIFCVPHCPVRILYNPIRFSIFATTNMLWLVTLHVLFVWCWMQFGGTCELRASCSSYTIQLFSLWYYVTCGWKE
jgi:hypothetical protein